MANRKYFVDIDTAEACWTAEREYRLSRFNSVVTKVIHKVCDRTDKQTTKPSSNLSSYIRRYIITFYLITTMSPFIKPTHFYSVLKTRHLFPKSFPPIHHTCRCQTHRTAFMVSGLINGFSVFSFLFDILYIVSIRAVDKTWFHSVFNRTLNINFIDWLTEYPTIFFAVSWKPKDLCPLTICWSQQLPSQTFYTSCFSIVSLLLLSLLFLIRYF